MSNQLKSAIIDTEIVFDLCLTNLSSATASDYKCSITNLGLVEVQSGAYHDAFTSQDTPISISEMIDILKPEIIMIGYNNQYDFIKEIDNLNRQIDFKIVIKKCGSIENSLHKISKILPILIREGSHFVINHAGKGNIEMSGADFDFCNGCILEKDKKDYFILLDYMIYYFFNKYYPELVEPKIRSTYFLLFDMIHKTRNYELLTNIKLIFNRRRNRMNQLKFKLTAYTHFILILKGLKVLLNSIGIVRFLEKSQDINQEFNTIRIVSKNIEKGIVLSQNLKKLTNGVEYTELFKKIEDLIKDIIENVIVLGNKYGRSPNQVR